MAIQLATIISSALTLIVLILLVFELWPSQRVDAFRQQMFEVRDELFDLAIRKEISFDDQAYVLLRQLMNGFIRYAHNLTPFRVLFSFLRWNAVANRPVEDWSASWGAALNHIPDEGIRKKVEELHSKALSLVAGQLILSPGLVLIFVLPLTICVLLAIQVTNLKGLYRATVSKIPMKFLEDEAVASVSSAG